jgi:oligosaccharide repeat unit polymerase
MMMLTILALAAVSLVNFRFSRTVAYPPFILSSMWMATLLFLWLLGDMFYPLTAATQMYFLAGIVAFSAGGLLALIPNMGTYVKSQRLTTREDRAVVHRILDIALIAAFACLPIYFRYMKGMAFFAKRNSSDLQQIRKGLITAMNVPGGTGFRIEPLLLPIFTALAILAFFEYDGGDHRRWRTYLFILAGLGYALCSSGRSEVLLLLIGLVAVVWIRLKPPQLRLLGGCAIAFLLLFAVNQVILGKTNTKANASFRENLPAVLSGFASYAVGGVVGFDYVLRNPGGIENGWKPDRVLSSVLNKFGGHVKEPSRDLGYVGIGNGFVTNVYTALFAFVDYGLFGMMFWMLSLGAANTLAYRRAIRGSPFGMVFYATCLYGTVVSVFAEEWISRTSYVLKATVIVVLLYYVVPAFARQFTRKSSFRDSSNPGWRTSFGVGPDAQETR